MRCRLPEAAVLALRGGWYGMLATVAFGSCLYPLSVIWMTSAESRVELGWKKKLFCNFCV